MQRKYLLFLLTDSSVNGSYRHCTNLSQATDRTEPAAVCPQRVGRTGCCAAPASKPPNLDISPVICLLICCVAAINMILSSILSYFSESSEFRSPLHRGCCGQHKPPSVAWGVHLGHELLCYPCGIAPLARVGLPCVCCWFTELDFMSTVVNSLFVTGFLLLIFHHTLVEPS